MKREGTGRNRKKMEEKNMEKTLNEETVRNSKKRKGIVRNSKKH